MRTIFLSILLAFVGKALLGQHAEAPRSLVMGITAHRGNSSEFPENTIPAFKSAIHLGVDWAELDVHATKDGRLVVIHDASTGRVGDQDLLVASHTYEELKAVDVATAFREKHGLTRKQCPPQTIPVLEDVLRLFSGNGPTNISIQPKADCVAAAIDIVKRLDMIDRVAFNDGNLTYMSEVKRLAPEIRVFWDRPADSDIADDIRISKLHGFEALVIQYKGITAGKVQKVKAAGMEIGAWTVNDTEVMASLMELGVQRLYTDEPQKLMLLHEDPETIFCEGLYPGHLQGICSDDKGNLYWSWTDRIVKTDAKGKIMASVAAPSHQGDLCFHDGRIYVAVNLGKFNRADDSADSWVYEYDARTLRQIRRVAVPELVFGAGGMAYHRGKFVIVGGLPPGSADNHVYEYDEEFRFRKAYPLNVGYTEMGIQTIAYAFGSWWAGCYGEPKETLQLNEDYRLEAKHGIDTSVGLAGLTKPYFWKGNNRRTAFGKNYGYIRRIAMENP